jgi:hypothetical protein
MDRAALSQEAITAWGKEVGGLRTGLSISNPSDVYIGGKAVAVVKLRNVTKETITVSAWPLWMNGPKVVDLSGKRGTDRASIEPIPEGQKIFTSDTGELTWNLEQPEAGYLAVNTPNTKLFTGYPKGRTIALGGVQLSIGKTRLDWATVSLVSRNATGFGESGRAADILVAATGLSENKGMTIERLSKTEITIRDKWGEGPVLAEGIPATLVLPADSGSVQCFALDPSGNRKTQVTVEKAGAGSKIVLKPEYETVWYEIVVK